MLSLCLRRCCESPVHRSLQEHIPRSHLDPCGHEDGTLGRQIDAHTWPSRDCTWMLVGFPSSIFALLLVDATSIVGVLPQATHDNWRQSPPCLCPYGQTLE